MLVGPDLRVRRINVEVIRTTLCHAMEMPLTLEVEQVLTTVGVSKRRQAQARHAILEEQLGAARLGPHWLLRLPADASF